MRHSDRLSISEEPGTAGSAVVLVRGAPAILRQAPARSPGPECPAAPATKRGSLWGTWAPGRLGDLPDDRHSQDDRDDVQDDREHPVEEQRAFVVEERPDEAEDPKTVVIRAELALAPDRAIFEADLDLDPADIVLTARRDSARELFSCRPEPGREGHPTRHIAVRFRVGVDVNGRPPPVREQLVADVLREPHIIGGGHEARFRALIHLVVLTVTRVHPYHPGLVAHRVRVDGWIAPRLRPVGGDAVYVLGVEPVRERAPDGGRVRLRLPPEAVPGRR